MLTRFGAPLDASLVPSIEELVPPDEEGDFEFLQHFSVSRNKQHWYAIITKEDQKSTQLTIKVTCGRGTVKSTKPLPPVSDLLLLLAKIAPGPVAMECNIRFNFKRSRRLHTVVTLPMRVSSHPMAPFTELRGIHVHAEGTEAPAIDAVIDTDDGDDLSEMLFFTAPFVFSPSTPDEIVTLALKLNESLIWAESNDATKGRKQ